jgi:aspartate 1-decarboxylase
MQTHVLKSKIQQLVVTQSSVEYPGSVALPEELMLAAKLKQFEQVHVNNKTNGNRIITYVVKSKENNVTLNGAASKRFNVGDEIHVVSYAIIDDTQADKHQPILVLADKKNKLIECKPYIL